ncbi:hypothetical protein [Macrococcoides caseolyticum]|uniref:Uncharacterized protein n=1 Tax=Macrococcoides caseolyticum TaxID=69966 RepID=A0ACC9MP25_9STAP|nr:hypothetical protein [Macrococcus caseolyticus]PKE40471.1 hypothetical protein CW675_01810 [Macrococcus caseolyticus]PKE55325.1 hypothetical protein CW682_12335 [Macrococcus caseolyticus]
MKPKTSARIYFDENKHRAAVSLDTYKVRISRDGMTFEEALTTPPKRTNKVSDEYKKWSNIAVENGINKAYFWQRVKEYGWSFERAATEKVKRYKKETDENIVIEKDSDRAVKKMIISLLNAGEPVPKKYEKRFPELFENRI